LQNDSSASFLGRKGRKEPRRTQRCQSRCGGMDQEI